MSSDNIITRWLPPCYFQGDGLTGVPNLHYIEAGRRHDWRYRFGSRWPDLTWGQTRKIYDLAFLWDMRNIDLREVRRSRGIRRVVMAIRFATTRAVIRRVYYFGVRLAGWWCVNRDPSKRGADS